MSDEVMTDREVLRRQYEDDRNLRARHRLWDISPSEPQLDFNRWSAELLNAREGDLVLDAGCGNGRPLALLQQRRCTAVGVDRSLGMVRTAHHELVGVATSTSRTSVRSCRCGRSMLVA